MKCLTCSYYNSDPQDVLSHMIANHGLTYEKTPPYLQKLWEARGSGFYEADNPLTGKAPIHQANANRNEVIRVYGATPFAKPKIIPSVPPPWMEIEKDYFALNELILDTISKKVILEGKLTPGHGTLKLITSQSEEKRNLLLQKEVRTKTNKETLLEDFKPYVNSPDYKKWEIKFMSDSVQELNKLRGGLIGNINV